MEPASQGSRPSPWLLHSDSFVFFFVFIYMIGFDRFNLNVLKPVCTKNHKNQTCFIVKPNLKSQCQMLKPEANKSFKTLHDVDVSEPTQCFETLKSAKNLVRQPRFSKHELCFETPSYIGVSKGRSDTSRIWIGSMQDPNRTQ